VTKFLTIRFISTKTLDKIRSLLLRL